MAPATTRSVAELVVEFLLGHRVERIFGLQGGHIQPIWDNLAQRGVSIVDVRDEGAAVHMAHAHAALSGQLGVAMVTAGPGVTNCVTAVAHAHLERVPVLLTGGPGGRYYPRPCLCGDPHRRAAREGGPSTGVGRVPPPIRAVGCSPRSHRHPTGRVNHRRPPTPNSHHRSRRPRRRPRSPDAITIADGGDILSFARMGLRPKTYLDAGAFGCLGVGIPYGVAAALAHPDRQVVVISGDGAFGINAMEIDTAVRHGAKVVFVIANNAAWNIERLDQELNYGGRVVGTTLRYSDYALMAQAFELHAERVTEPQQLLPALEKACASTPALVDVVLTQDALSSDAGKGLGWVPDYHALTAWDDAERRRRQLS